MRGDGILVFRTGNLGDTLAAIPALALVREHFQGDRITVLCNGGIGSQVVAKDVLEGSGLVDGFIVYPTLAGRSLPARLMIMAGVLARLRAGRFRCAVYLPETRRSDAQMKRDRWLFRLAGLDGALGLDAPRPQVVDAATRPLPTLPREMERLVAAVGQMGIPTRPLEACRRSLGLSNGERERARRLMDAVPRGRIGIGMAIGSKMPAKCWPMDRYAEVLRALIGGHGVFPVLVGGEEDRTASDALIALSGGEGLNLCGRLGIRESAAVLGACRMYLGNDTGPMHLAASEDVPCVALFSARDYPGSWYPAGTGHVVLRTSPSCEGCMLQVCHAEGNRCLTDIGVGEVLRACGTVLGRVADHVGST